jgi:hypothetical protein
MALWCNLISPLISILVLVEVSPDVRGYLVDSAAPRTVPGCISTESSSVIADSNSVLGDMQERDEKQLHFPKE